MTGEQIGAKVKAARLDAGMSQEDLARQIGVSVFTVSRWERGASDLSTARLVQIATALNVSPADLLRDEDDK